MIQKIAELLQYPHTTLRNYPIMPSQWVVTAHVTFCIVFPNGVEVWYSTEAAEVVGDYYVHCLL